MQKKVLFFIFALLSVFVVLLLVLLLNSSGNTNNKTVARESKSSNAISVPSGKKESWTKRLYKYQKSDFLYPVNELYITIKFPEKVEKKAEKYKKYYRIKIPNLNDYSIFCILRVLDNKDFAYTIEDGYEKSLLYIEAENPTEIESISKDFKKYGIEYKIDNRLKNLKYVSKKRIINE